MIRAKFAVRLGAGLSVILLFLARASAQSTISGQVKDTSGAVMAGVAVEASSEALIERARSVVSNGEGRYAIVDVRPGSYTVTFTLMGFNTVKQQVEVPANVTVPVDATMQVGSIGQTVEVAGLVATSMWTTSPTRKCSHAATSTQCQPRAICSRLAPIFLPCT